MAIVWGLLFLNTSCRLGEFLSEADPETKAEIEKEEELPQMEKDYKKKGRPDQNSKEKK